MKRQYSWFVAVLLTGCLVCVGSLSFACSGGSSGGNSGNSGGSEGGSNHSPIDGNSSPTGIKSNGPAYVDIKTPAQVTKKWNNIKKMDEAQRFLNHFQRVESIGDKGTFTAQWSIFLWGIQGGSAMAPARVILIPFAAFWQIPKHASRTAWGYTTGKLDTVEEVNKRSWVGRQVNHYLIQHIK